MSQSIIGSISVVLVALAYGAVLWWVFGKHRKKDFDEAANLPFDKDEREATRQNDDEKRRDKP